MQHTRQTKFVMYLDNFLEAKTLHSLQETLLTLKYGESKDGTGRIIGKRHTFPKSFHDDPLLKLIKGYFFPHRNLVPIISPEIILFNTSFSRPEAIYISVPELMEIFAA